MIYARIYEQNSSTQSNGRILSGRFLPLLSKNPSYVNGNVKNTYYRFRIL